MKMFLAPISPLQHLSPICLPEFSYWHSNICHLSYLNTHIDKPTLQYLYPPLFMR